MRTTGTPRIAFDDVGDAGPALLCLPGWCGERSAFRPLYPHVKRRILAVDWRGHGGSEAAAADFGERELIEDALAVIEAAGADRIIPVATAHAGWIAIELRKRLGADRVPGIALVSWMVLGAPPPFIEAIAALQRPETTLAVRDKLFAMWTTGVDHRGVAEMVGRMGAVSAEMWQRGGREIAAGFARHPVPLDVLAPLACPTLHAYGQPTDPGFLRAQQDYAAKHPWFQVVKLDAQSHFPSIEAPEQLAAALEAFASRVAQP